MSAPKRSSAGFYYPIGTLDDFQKWATTAFAERDRDESAGFATREKPTGEFIGSTRCMSISLLEIGSIWVIPCWQRTAVNTEAKYLMLSHAFETLGCIRVEFKTDASIRNLALPFCASAQNRRALSINTPSRRPGAPAILFTSASWMGNGRRSRKASKANYKPQVAKTCTSYRLRPSMSQRI